jgi:hypothetical protein
MSSKWNLPLYPFPVRATKSDIKTIRQEFKYVQKLIKSWVINSQHFTMPDNLQFANSPHKNGRIWHGEIINEECHLPYRKITISTHCDDVKVVTLYEESTGETIDGRPLWRMISMEQKPNDVWRMPLGMVTVNQEPDNPQIGTRCQVALLSPTTTNLTADEDQHELADSITRYSSYDIDALFSLLTILHNQPQSAITSSNNKSLSNRKVIKRGRRTKKKDTFKELVINDHYAPTRSGVSIPTGVTQRAHTRRGHERHYKNGKVIWIDSYKAGNASKGTINKDYRVEA